VYHHKRILSRFHWLKFGLSATLGSAMNEASHKPVLFTIGHSNHSFEHFASLLARHRIERILDVRSFAVSRLHWFSRGELEVRLKGENVAYEFLGRELGGRGWERADGSSMELEEIVATNRFQAGLTRLRNVMRDSRACLMCAEAGPANCHRTKLIVPQLEDIAEIFHITATGAVFRDESHSQMRLF
jgi:uncharacterized protein (DUF488 family)